MVPGTEPLSPIMGQVDQRRGWLWVKRPFTFYVSPEVAEPLA